jgi:hypothetical protein
MKFHKIHNILIPLILTVYSTACIPYKPDVDIPLAISQTQTAVVAEIENRPPKQTIVATTFAPQYGKNVQSFNTYGISFDYDGAIVSSVQPEVLTSTETWKPYHLQNANQAVEAISGGVPDYFKFSLEETQSVPDRTKSYLMIRPLRNTDGQLYPAIVNDTVLSQEIEKLETRLKEHTVQDRFFDGTRLEIQRQYLSFKNGKGIRYVTAVPINNQPGEINSQNMTYVFEGLTDDGRYYVELRIWSGYTGIQDNTIAPQDQQRYLNDLQTYSEYISKIDWQMKMLPSSAFTPDLNQIDIMINSLNVAPVIAAPTAGSTSAGSDLGLGEATFSDTFEKAPSYLFMGQDAFTKTETKDGSVIMSSMSQSSDRWRIIELYPLGDVYVQMIVRTGDTCTGKDGYGWILRAIPEGSNYNSGYVFSVACDGSYRIYRLHGGEYFEIRNWKTNPYILAGPNRTNKVGVMAQGNKMALYVNSTLIDQFEDNMFQQGSFGPIISSPENANFMYSIDEISFWNLYQKVVAVPSPTSVESSLYVPLELTQCETLQMEVGKIIGITGTRVEYPFLDPLDENARGKACHIEFSASGEQITSLDQVLNALSVFDKLGWTNDPKYLANAPNGEKRAYRKPSDIISLIEVKSEPAEGVICPPDTAMALCLEQLQPAQITYSLTIDAAQRSFTTPTPSP